MSHFLCPLPNIETKFIDDDTHTPPDGTPRNKKLPPGLAATLEYQASLVREHILNGLDPYLHPDRADLNRIPQEALDHVHLSNPPVFTSPMTRILHQSFPSDLLHHFLRVAQSDIRDSILWIEECQYRCHQSCPNDHWSWELVDNFDSASLTYSMHRAITYHKEHVSRHNVLAHIAQARHWPEISAYAESVLNNLKKKMAEWDEEYGVVYNKGDDGIVRKFSFSQPPTIVPSSDVPDLRFNGPTSFSTGPAPEPNLSHPSSNNYFEDTFLEEDPHHVTPSQQTRHPQTARRSRPFKPGHHSNPHRRSSNKSKRRSKSKSNRQETHAHSSNN